MTRPMETAEWLSGPFKRMIVAAGVRVADADEIELGMLIGMRADLNAAIQYAVDGQRARGVSWTGIARSIGITAQGAQQRWGHHQQAH